MASLLISNSFSLSPRLRLQTTASRCSSLRHSHVPFHQPSCLGRKARGLTVVTRAGPSTTQYVFAFVLPLSLLALTVFASVKVSDKLDRDFLEELILNEAMREGDEEEEDEEEENGGIIPKEKVQEPLLPMNLQEPVLPRTRNRPKREI